MGARRCEQTTSEYRRRSHAPPAGAGKDGGHQEEDRRQSKPLIEFHDDPSFAAFKFEGIKIGDGRLDHRRRVHARACGGEPATGFGGEFAHHFGLHPAENRFPGAVQQLAVGVFRMWNEAAVIGAHGDRENVNAGRFGFGEHGVDVAVVFLAVAEDDERIVFLPGLLERLDGEADGCGEIRSAERRPCFVDLFDGLTNGTVVDGERGVKIGGTGEADDADAFVRHGFEHFVNDDFCLREAVRADIGNAHAAGEIECDEDVATQGLLGVGAGVSLGSGKSGDQRRGGT